MARKSLKEEIKVVQRMAQLASPVFGFIQECLAGEDDDRKRWAVEQMMKLYAKAVPTQITGENGSPIPIQVINFKS